jgi:Trk-type K+ transport system membrane component
MDRVQKPSDSVCYTPSSELFRFCLIGLASLVEWGRVKDMKENRSRKVFPDDDDNDYLHFLLLFLFIIIIIIIIIIIVVILYVWPLGRYSSLAD